MRFSGSVLVSGQDLGCSCVEFELLGFILGFRVCGLGLRFSVSVSVFGFGFKFSGETAWRLRLLTLSLAVASHSMAEVRA